MRRDDWLLHQLPVAMTEHDPLEGGVAEVPFFVRFLGIFQNIANTVVQQVDALPHMFDPDVAPDAMVRTMAQWIGVDWVDSSLDDRRQREIVRRYAELIQWRGTKRGLRLLLELLTDGPVEIRDSGGVFAEGEAPAAAGHVRIDVARPGWNRPEGEDEDETRKIRDMDLVRIVRSEIPASVTFDMWIADDHVWPPASATGVAIGHLPAPTATVGTDGGVARTRDPRLEPGEPDA